MNGITVIEHDSFHGELPLAAGPDVQVLAQLKGESHQEFTDRVLRRLEALKVEPTVHCVQYFLSSQAGAFGTMCRRRITRALLDTLAPERAHFAFVGQAGDDTQMQSMALIDSLRVSASNRVSFSLRAVESGERLSASA